MARPMYVLLLLTGLLLWRGEAAAATLQMAHQFARDSIPDRAANKFADLVVQKSQGSLRITVHPASSFGDERDQLSLMQKGRLDLAITGDLLVSSISAKYLVVSMPFIYRDAAHALAVYDGPLGEGMRKEFLGLGLRALSWYHVGTRMLTANTPIRNMADLQGLNLRLPPDAGWIETWRVLGASPRQVPFTDLPAALKLGRVDAQENPPNFIRANKLYADQKYLVLSNHIPQRQFIFTAEKTWTSLTAGQRRLITEAATEAARWTSALAAKEQELDLKWLVEQGGMIVLPFDRTGIAESISGVPRTLAGAEGEQVFRQIVDLSK